MSELMSEERLAELEWLANNVSPGERHQQAIRELAVEVRTSHAEVDAQRKYRNRLREFLGRTTRAERRVDELEEELTKVRASVDRVRVEISRWGTQRSREAMLRALDGDE